MCILLESLFKYYDDETNMQTFVEILQDKSVISLRMIDWFITKYAKTKNISYEIDGKPFFVYQNYKFQLKAYSKRQMDPFCRRNRIALNKHNIEIITTTGQMNFFRWAIENKILNYIIDNIALITKEMKVESKTCHSRKNKNTSEKRSFTKQSCETIVHFN